MSLSVSRDGFPKGSALERLYEEEHSEGPVYARGFDTVVTRGILRSAPSFKVAVKKVAKERVFDAGHLKRCRAEADFMRRLAHKHVIPVLDALETESAFLTIMPYAASGSLHTRTRAGAVTATELEARNFISQALAALAFVHSKQCIHGDVKPHNFLLSDSGDGRFVVHLCDFGMADALEHGALKFTGLRGTSGYFAPEQINHEDYGLAVDMFAFGVMLHQLLVGYGPFDPPARFEELEFETRYWKHMTAEVQDFLTGLLQLDPQKRLGAAAAKTHAWMGVEISAEQQVEKFVTPPSTALKFRHVSDCPEIFALPAEYLREKETHVQSAEASGPNPNEPDETFAPAERT